MRLQEKRTMLSGKDAVNLLQSGKLAGRLGGRKFIPKWVVEDPFIFEDLVDTTLLLFDDDPNTASDEVIQYLMKCCFEDPDKWSSILQHCPDTLIELSKAFATDWFKKDVWQKELDNLITKKFNITDWNRLEHDIQDVFSKRQVKKGKTISNTNNLYDTLYDDGTWKLCTPKCFEGSVELASHIEPFKSGKSSYTKARWCTAAQKSYYDRYTRDGNKLYVIQYWENGKYTRAWQLAFWKTLHIEFKNKLDSSNYSAVRKAPDELLEKIVYDNPRESLLQGLSLKDLFERMPRNGKIEDSIKVIQYEVVKYDEKGYGINRVGQIVAPPKDLESTTLNIKAFQDHNLEYQLTFTVKIGKKVVTTCTLTDFKDAKKITFFGEIPDHAFKDFENLETVICKDCWRVGAGAFSNCRNLKKVVLDPDMGYIGSHAFENCSSLERVNLYRAIPEFERSAFQGCTSLKELTVRGEYAYTFLKPVRNQLEKLVIDGFKVVVDSECFQLPNLIELEILSSVDVIETRAFEDCENLVSVKFPKNKKVKVEDTAFLNCKNLEFVENIESVDGNFKRIFTGCPKLYKELQNEYNRS